MSCFVICMEDEKKVFIWQMNFDNKKFETFIHTQSKKRQQQNCTRKTEKLEMKNNAPTK